MEKIKTVKSDYFYGNKISDYGLQNGYVDYRTLAKSFEGVLNNNIINNTIDIGYWEQISGFVDNSEEIEELKEEIYELEEELDELDEDDDREEFLKIQDKIIYLENEINTLKNEEFYNNEIYQYYIVDDGGAELLQRVDEIVFYNDTLDMYVWGVTHWGTSWDYVLTNIKIEKE